MAVSIKEPVPAKGMPDCPEWILRSYRLFPNIPLCYNLFVRHYTVRLR